MHALKPMNDHIFSNSLIRAKRKVLETRIDSVNGLQQTFGVVQLGLMNTASHLHLLNVYVIEWSLLLGSDTTKFPTSLDDFLPEELNNQLLFDDEYALCAQLNLPNTSSASTPLVRHHAYRYLHYRLTDGVKANHDLCKAMVPSLGEPDEARRKRFSLALQGIDTSARSLYLFLAVPHNIMLNHVLKNVTDTTS